MKCAIIGGSTLPYNINENKLTEIKEFGRWLAQNNIDLLTGGCYGFPYVIGQECIKAGGNVKAYSPAKSEEEARNIYNHPNDGFNDIEYLKNPSETTNINFLVRSLPLINDADIIICLEGNWGTLFEIVTGIIAGKTQIIWQGFGGISDMFDGLYFKLSNNCKYDYKEKIYFFNDINSIKQTLIKIKRN